MAMSKKDFIALADTIKEHNRVASHPANASDMQAFTSDQLQAIVGFCRSQSPNFMRDRFLGYISGDNGSSGGKVRR